MAILAECPICHKKQSTKNKKCSCRLALDDAKKSKKVRYWINYRMPDGKQKREAMEKYTTWLDAQIEAKIQNVDHFVDQAAFSGGN